MKNLITSGNRISKSFMLISCLAAVLGVLLFGACINPISGEYELPALSITINPETEGVLVFKNETASPKSTKVWSNPAAPAAAYESTIGANSSYVVTETDSAGKTVPKRFAAGNLWFLVEDPANPPSPQVPLQVYTVAAFGVTYVTISDAQIDSGGGPTTIIKVDVVNPGGLFTVQLEDGNFTVKLDNDQYATINNYLDQKLIAPILVKNSSSYDVIFGIESVAYGTAQIEVPPHVEKTITLSNFNQADANHTVTARRKIDGKLADRQVQGKPLNVNVWRGYAIDSANNRNFVEVVDEHFSAPDITYRITANGGVGDPYVPAFTTTKLTFTFDSAPTGTPTINKVSGSNIGLGLLTKLTDTNDPAYLPDRVFTMTVSGLTVSPSETITFTCSTSGIDPDEHPVLVFKEGTPPTVTTVKYIYVDSGLLPPVGPFDRNVQYQLDWFFRYKIVTYENGVAVTNPAPQIVTKNKYGTFLTEASAAAYGSLTEQGAFRMGSRPSSGTRYQFDDGNASPSTWPYKSGLVFGTNVQTIMINSGIFGIKIPTQVNVGTNVVDGHVIEGMPETYIPYYGIGVTTNVKVYGHQVDLMVKR